MRWYIPMLENDPSEKITISLFSEMCNFLPWRNQPKLDFPTEEADSWENDPTLKAGVLPTINNGESNQVLNLNLEGS